MSDNNIVLVGCGNMGRAMVEGWLHKNVAKPNQIHVVEPNEELRQRAQQLGVHVYGDAQEISENVAVAYVLFAVKPQVFDKIAPAYQKYAGKAAFVSIMAGVKIAKFTELLGEKTAVVRTMPNTPAAIGEGMLVYCINDHVNAGQEEFVRALLHANGEVAKVEENQMDAVTGLSGSGPAYVFHMIECLARAGMQVGLDEDTALLLARQTVKGAGILAASSPEMPSVLRERVTSPNGTTAAGLAVLMGDKRMENMIVECVKAACERSKELGN